MQENKKTVSSISLILILAVSMIVALAQPASGQAGVPQPEKTSGFASVAPTLIGVGQQLTCNVWVNPLPTTYNYTAYWNGFYGVTVTFVRPDGTTDTFMPVSGTGGYEPGQTEALGALFFFYEPKMAGNWSLSFTMPAQNITWEDGTVQYLGCTSNTAYFTVQTDPVLAGLLNGYPWAPLPNPNVFWSYPINANNREWSQISGDWTGIFYTSASVVSPTCLRWQPYGSGPGTAHIVWDQPVYPGGIIGGSYGSLNYAQAQNYPLITGTVVMDGKVFMNVPYSGNQFRCIDEATGKVLYQVPGSITCGIHIPGNVYGQSGTAVAVGQAPTLLASSWGHSNTPYVWGTSGSNWNYYHPSSGALITQIANASSAKLVDGTVLAFGAGTIVGQTGRYVYRWNMTSVTNNNWPTGVTWKVPAPTTLAGLTTSIFAVSSDATIVVVGNKNEYWGYNADTGAELWHTIIPYPITSNEEIPLANVDDFIVWDATAATWHCYSMATGAELWETPSVAGSPWASTWTVYFSETNDFDNVYFTAPDGVVRAYSLADGHLLWTSQPIPSTEYTQNAVTFSMAGMMMVGGNIYAYAGYSLGYELNPVSRFACTICINATTGDTVFILNGGVAPAAAANGYLIESGIFDGNVYGVGKGPTKTTVEAPLTSTPLGDSITVKGSVLDMSPASQDYAVQARFPNGVPAVADAEMSEWMDYLYMQNATLLNSPPTPDGVTVSLSALDSNGGFTDLGTTTSDYAGQFAMSWTPPSEGLYKIFATFSGSESYFSSYAETALSVGPATHATNGGGTEVQPVDNTMTIIGVGVALAIVIAVVGALLFLALRKR